MRPTVIDRYILREVAQTWVAVMAVLVLILASNSLAHLLGKVVEGKVSGQVVAPFFLLQLTSYFVTLVPLGMFLALLLAFGRLYAESEMTAIAACGIGLARLYRPVVLVGLVGAAVTAALTFWASPWAERAGSEIAARVASQSGLVGVAPGRFNRADGGLFFAESRGDNGVFKGVFALRDSRTGGRRIVRAASARERVDADSGQRYLEFRNGHSYTLGRAPGAVRAVAFDRYDLRLPTPSLRKSDRDPDSRSLTELLRRGQPEDIAEVEWRLSLPFACFLIALAALPLSRTTPRQGRYGRIAIALVVYIVYANLLVFARDRVEDMAHPGWLDMAWAHALMIVALVVLIARQAGWRRIRSLLLPGGRLHT